MFRFGMRVLRQAWWWGGRIRQGQAMTAGGIGEGAIVMSASERKSGVVQDVLEELEGSGVPVFGEPAV